MTGFGRCDLEEGTRKISVEMKSVNHRFLEVGIKMPKKLNVFESRIRDVIKQYAQRGKIDIFITYEDLAENKVSLKYNRDLAKEYMDIFEEMAQQFGKANDVSISVLSRFPEVITAEDAKEDEEEVWHFIEKAISGACAQLSETRIREGENLKNDILSKLDTMSGDIDFIETRSPEIMKEYRTKLENKVNELLSDTTIDEGRLAAEVIIYADKICVDEETVRLRSHIAHAAECMKQEGGIGRKMDFIAQEMNREANTILSKANDIEISNHAINLKTEIEKVREQIQNIE
jgi:uncharacterized protein (TIGR00255 family)